MSVLSRSKVHFVLVLCLAGAIRLVGLSENPPGLFRDEADKAYTTYSLLETRKDLAGRPWPLQVKAFGAYTSPLYHWFSLPILGVFGVSVWSVRLLAALAGTCACLGVYLLGREMAGKRAGLLAALLLAVSPWSFSFSRWANQGILMTLFIPLAVWATWKAVHLERPDGKVPWKWIAFAGIFWGLGWIAYAPARLFVPLLLFSLLGIELWRKEERYRNAKTVFTIGVITVLAISPFLVDVLLHWNETQTRLKFLAADKPMNVATFLGNYFSHWDPRYLLLSGDANPRHHIFDRTGFGQLTWLEAVACLAGVYALLKERGRTAKWLFSWLILAPVPAAITQEGLPHALRTLMIIPAFALLGGIGMAYLLEKAPKGKRFLGGIAIGVGFAVQTALCLYLYGVEYPETSAPYWDAGTIEAIRLVEDTRQEGESCLVSGMIEYPKSFLEFALLPDPRSIQDGAGVEGYECLPTGTRFDLEKMDRKGLFLLRPGELRKPPWWKEIRPDPPDEKVEHSWRLYRSEGVSPAAPK